MKRIRDMPTTSLKRFQVSDFDMSVFQRDYFQCSKCGNTVIEGVSLNAIPFWGKKKIIENYITVCDDCIKIGKHGEN